MHFSLSQRDDTEYWRHWTNKTVAPDLVNQTFAPYTNGYSKCVSDVHRQNHHEFLGGIHCIGTGMHWWPTDKPCIIWSEGYGDIDFKASFGDAVRNLVNRKLKWREAVHECPTPYEFLKENYYD